MYQASFLLPLIYFAQSNGLDISVKGGFDV
jgi:hypothetical protein